MKALKVSKAVSFAIRKRSSCLAVFQRSLSDKSKEWIPPSRPLSGDKGLYQERESGGKPIDLSKGSASLDDFQKFSDLDSEQFFDKEITDELSDGFVDIDDIDIKELQKRFKSGEFAPTDDYDGETDIDALMKELDGMELNDDEFKAMIANQDSQNNDEEGGRKISDEEYNDFVDKFQAHFETEDFVQKSKDQDQATIPDWLSTRRAKLKGDAQTSGLLKPSEYRKSQRETSEIPIIKHTLLSSDEIIQCLFSLGGQDVKLVTPDEDLRSYLGWKGLIIATGTSDSHIRVMAEAIVDNLRRRKLAERGVIGAKFGSEGGEDPTMSSRARRKRRIGRGKKTDDGWMVVDCRNFVVHIQDDVTRRNVHLEGLWGPGEECKAIRRLDVTDDDAVDDFVAANPISDEYAQRMSPTDEFWGDGKYRGGYASNQTTRNKSGRWSPSNNQKRKQKNRRP